MKEGSVFSEAAYAIERPNAYGAAHWLETLRLRRIKILESGYHVGHYSPTTYL